jgi:hypothetical protein
MTEVSSRLVPLHEPSQAKVSQAVEGKVDGSIKNLIKDRKNFINLLILLFLWIVSAFDYFLINF